MRISKRERETVTRWPRRCEPCEFCSCKGMNSTMWARNRTLSLRWGGPNPGRQLDCSPVTPRAEDQLSCAQTPKPQKHRDDGWVLRPNSWPFVILYSTLIYSDFGRERRAAQKPVNIKRLESDLMSAIWTLFGGWGGEEHGRVFFFFL